MSRSARLMRLMDVMRRLPAPVTAARLAQETGVSLRQLYRDIATLRSGGALIDGEAGLGYVLVEDNAVPPQSFSRLEIEALMLAMQSLGTIADEALLAAGHDAIARLIASLPERQSRQALHSILRAFPSPPSRSPPKVALSQLRQACWDEAELIIGYMDLAGNRSERLIWPLALSYTDQSLMLLAHCRLRMDFRIFHVNRIESLRPSGGSFRPQRVALTREFRQQCDAETQGPKKRAAHDAARPLA